MPPSSPEKAATTFDFGPYNKDHYRDLQRRNVIRLLLTYLLPLVLLAIYFIFQNNAIILESRRLHLKGIAENQARTLDLFLTERLVNLSNLIDDPKLQIPPVSSIMQDYLRHLRKNSDAFVDIGFFDSAGVQTSYSGPFPSLERRNYSSEDWYRTLKSKDTHYIITDIYLGFRQEPHFTIAVKRVIEGQTVVMRATLGPEKIYEYIRSLEGSQEVYTSIVNKTGQYQVVTQRIGTPLEKSSIVPPADPKLGVEEVDIEGADIIYAYSWLESADWALIVQNAGEDGSFSFIKSNLRIMGLSAILILAIFLIIINRARQLVKFQMETDRTRAQLEHASKLASVGELAAGIAHEINNPLAIISEEAGLMRDFINPEFGQNLKCEDLIPHLENIHESVFRCRDITRKLLGFVRRTEMDMKRLNIHQLLDGVLDGILGHEMAVSNIEVVRKYGLDVPELVTDGNQLQQVILNIVNNGVDAIGHGPGKITVATSVKSKFVRISISDTGMGMSPEQMEKIFLPFYTTKEVGKGTGLGLSVSYGIIKNLGGKIEVESVPRKGSTFTINLPIDRKNGK
ncbi:MAG: ATP-binding protein [Candidatus Zixiibacteriota bacterium]